jgi:hypothetical protein
MHGITAELLDLFSLNLIFGNFVKCCGAVSVFSQIREA